MTQFFHIHKDNPQQRLIKQASKIIDSGGIVAMPTDSSYALVCHLDDKNAVDRLRKIRGVDEKHHLTLLCRDLSEISSYAKIDNIQYRLIKSKTPGPFTFILEATKEVPRRLSHPARKTIGLRVPEHTIALSLLKELGQPLLGTTLIPIGTDIPMVDPNLIADLYKKQIELVIDGGNCSLLLTTIVDLTGDHPVIVRKGKGDSTLFS
tara:strand:+ start:115 stop:735 length:621 start_codon:yes stop_codon:yes gene_type:complete